MRSFFGLSRQDLLPFVERPVRAARVFQAVYRDRVSRFGDIGALPQSSAEALSGSLTLALPSVDSRFDSEDGTSRYLMRLADGQTVESVRIPDGSRATFCISSQIGCGLGCSFCLTGQLGWIRDLSASEIVSQILVMRRDSGVENVSERCSVVFMGMGEPLQNYENVVRAIDILRDDNGLAIPITRITLSTAGLIPGLERLAREPAFPNLSISLTGVTDRMRDRLMPINRKYPIAEIVDFVRALPSARQSRVMFECVMIKGHTDSTDDARALALLLEGTRAKVNLIPLNVSPEIPFDRADDNSILQFQKILVDGGIATFIRRNRGNDISGACGQLKQKELAGRL